MPLRERLKVCIIMAISKQFSLRCPWWHLFICSSYIYTSYKVVCLKHTDTFNRKEDASAAEFSVDFSPVNGVSVESSVVFSVSVFVNTFQFGLVKFSVRDLCTPDLPKAGLSHRQSSRVSTVPLYISCFLLIWVIAHLFGNLSNVQNQLGSVWFILWPRLVEVPLQVMLLQNHT